MPSAFAKAIAPTHCDRRLLARIAMIRWIIVIFLALLLISWVSPLLQRMGFGKLPGDLRFRAFGRNWFIPLTTTILLSLVAAGISRLL